MQNRKWNVMFGTLAAVVSLSLSGCGASGNRSEQAEDVRPGLTSHIENLDQYQTVFIGCPNMEQGFECA